MRSPHSHPHAPRRAPSRVLRRSVGVCAALAITCTSATANTLPPLGPSPADRYAGLLAVDTTGFVAPASASPQDFALQRIALDAAPVAPQSGSLKAGLGALDARDAATARAIALGMPAGSVERDVLHWAIALSPRADAASIDNAMRQVPDWPNQAAMAANLERALVRERSGDALIAAFGNADPQTDEAKLALAQALAQRDQPRAAKLLRPIWHAEVMDAGEEAAIMRWGGHLLQESDHRRRMAMLIYRDRIRGAERLAPRAGAGASALVRAAGAVARKSGADAALAAVPQSLRSNPIYLYAAARHLRRADQQRAAARTLAPHRFDASAAVSPRTWWAERRTLTRELLDQGDSSLAYSVAANHSGGRATDTIDGEWTAGWIALRFLNDPGTAKRHFLRVLEVGNRALSVSRGAYWLGRAEEALGNSGAARAAFARAAEHRTTFYGQLAMQRLGNGSLSIPYPRPSDADRRGFAGNRFVRAIDLLEGVGHPRRARSLYRHLAATLTAPGQLALLTAKAERAGQFQLGLQLGKRALSRGLPVEALAFPTGAIPSNAPLSQTGRALAYAIARQESAFDREAVSGAGARGLLQLMPATAKEEAGKMGLPYSRARLTSDPGYNAALGAHFLTRLLDRFDSSYVLTAAAYNAGPSRAIAWRERYGDPVGKPVDEVVDWIERIPFTETRNYVQRVVENYGTYRARLDGRPLSIERDLTVGRR